MRTIYAEYNINHDSIDVYTSVKNAAAYVDRSTAQVI